MSATQPPPPPPVTDADSSAPTVAPDTSNTCTAAVGATRKLTIAAVGTWSFAQQACQHIVSECFKLAIGGDSAAGATFSNADEERTLPAAAPSPVFPLPSADGGFVAVSPPTPAPTTPFATASGKLGELLVCGMELVEADKEVHTVGIYSYPNVDGVLQLDAAYINPSRGHFGSVLGITGFHGAIRGAYMVATNGPHSVMCGEGAERYMASHGITHYDSREPPTWHDGDGMGKEVAPSHDTVGVVALCGDEVVVGCSTSGMRNKLPGRVGDSAIFGSGLYAAAGIGGATGTGDGDLMVRIPFSYIAVDAMRHGMAPQAAAEHAIARLAECPGFVAATSEAAIVVMNMEGVYGWATTPAYRGVFTPSYASLETLKASAEAQANPSTAAPSPSSGGCVVQ